MNAFPSSLHLHIERDSVCAGDDVDAPHSKSISVQSDSSLALTLNTILSIGYLAQIAEGRATWIVQASGRPLAVIAQQWKSPQFLVDPDTLITDYVEPNSTRSLFFRYWCQADPDLVYQCLKNGDPLPAR